MRKVFLLLTTILLFQLAGLTQYFYVSSMFPGTVIGDPYADTLINTRALMVKEGIKKIYAYQTQPTATMTFASKTVCLNEIGDIEKMTFCFRTNGGFTPCSNDTFLYDNTGRLMEMKMTDGTGSLYMRNITGYISERETKTTTIISMPGSDTSIAYKYFNEKGQMVRLKQIRKGQDTVHTSFYYNKDGLLDSIQYKNTNHGTFVFKRSERRKEKIIEMEDEVVRFKWIYNLSGQCTTSEFTRKELPPGVQTPDYKGTIKTKVSYYYNSDGTLSKVTQERSNMSKTTMYYSYSK